jgi:hypothetical protein
MKKPTRAPRIDANKRGAAISELYAYESEIAGTIRALLAPQLFVAVAIAAIYPRIDEEVDLLTRLFLIGSTILIGASVLLSGMVLTRPRLGVPLNALRSTDFHAAFDHEIRKVNTAHILRRLAFLGLVLASVGALAAASSVLLHGD